MGGAIIVISTIQGPWLAGEEPEEPVGPLFLLLQGRKGTSGAAALQGGCCLESLPDSSRVKVSRAGCADSSCLIRSPPCSSQL